MRNVAHSTVCCTLCSWISMVCLVKGMLIIGTFFVIFMLLFAWDVIKNRNGENNA